MSFKVMIVDDEPLARSELSRMVQEDARFDVVEQAPNGEDALKKLRAQPEIQVVFLDIEMPGMRGLEVASRLADWPEPPLVVFATAYHQYAVEAFDAGAFDYILKPYAPDRLQKTFERIEQLMTMRGAARQRLLSLQEQLAERGLIQKLVGHERNARDRVVIPLEEVLYFFAHYAEVSAVLPSRELIVNATLRELLDRLDSGRYAQTHKAYIVNLDQIDKVSPMFNGNYEITLKGKPPKKIPLSRRFAPPLKSRLGSW